MILGEPTRSARPWPSATSAPAGRHHPRRARRRRGLRRAPVRLGTYPVPFVDGSGGGDAFDAGYIAGLLDGLDELDCLRLASAVGASCVRAVGTTAGVFTRPEADAFVARHELPIEPI